ncbi:dTDP-4-dehydrorhamnose 3,5-epimerase [Neorhizobium galegae]|uniref:dTDP-4-dehydrorhamnose 3,5-epimerase n=1 Tax=Neorhizobium galegae TaxID=399 RepID=UPI000627AE33|nr:dTDP-4-dehydrorhamnose 3,5-epimerase [Neorhizobium galegae]KAA9389001.1 dTDP-4-dehydrorhamnose 3,5-epimerase [Neorhizobium galegae]KAB1110423.1 dTDP-4-dehydrorhamnose 3,5-epimerase [Neorhizobium galegae]MCM2498352.1 dTDP-4-dehydrorhamnose 3,5-epimerase [Neorhizobium galegae]MCQ1765639.1 dTDP-4-dehydrorhamnose 3,5-epimerase [Neorhizobium galegae]MCQ1774321.1 dTDP-4-dehydrorhamnose 3,5-epimerase [Neorhizobium galegae]
MRFESTIIEDVLLLTSKKFGDPRGYFMETFRKNLFESEVGSFTFVQDNRSYSAEAGTVRGLHFQIQPCSQGKLVSCSSGAFLDVAVDIRIGSPTYGKFVAVELSAENALQLWLPPGFAHGFCTLTADTVITYKVTDYYSAEHERGLLWNDPEIGIEWPVAADKAILSEKDRDQPKLSELQSNFIYAVNDEFGRLSRSR